MQEKILHSAGEAAKAALILQEKESVQFIENVARELAATFVAGKKLLVCGNGGSLCDAAHFAEELTGYYRAKRPALPAIVLSEPGHMSCVGNDAGFDTVFSRGVEAFGQPGDMLVVLTTSGNSENLKRAVETAKNRGLKTVAFLGKTGGQIKGMCDIEWIIEGFPFSDRIQEVHMAAIHIVIEMVEEILNQAGYFAKEDEKTLF